MTPFKIFLATDWRSIRSHAGVPLVPHTYFDLLLGLGDPGEDEHANRGAHRDHYPDSH